MKWGVKQYGQKWVNNFHMDYHEERWAPSEAACPERCRCSWTGRGTEGPPSCCSRSSQFPTPLSRISTLKLVNQLSAINSNGVKKHLVRPFCYILIPLFGDISLAYLCCAIIVVLFRGAKQFLYSLLLAQVYKRKEKFYTMGGQVNFFFPTWKLVVVTYSDRRQTATDTWNTPKQWFLGFCSSPLLDLIFKGLNSSACSIG